MAQICVLGLGYVGLPTAALLANSGYHVLGVDINRDVVESLKSGKTRLSEAGLDTLVFAAFQSGNLKSATEPEESDTFIICVPTPVNPDKTVDLRAVRSAAEAIAKYVKKGNLVILESTSPVGTTERDVGSIIKDRTGLAYGADYDLCYCPERVLPGNTVGELVHNDRIIGGIVPASAQRAKDIYDRFSKGKKILTTCKTAEMCKLMENTFRDVNIALANTFANIAEVAGVNVWDAIEYANLHPRVNILSPGPGVGGHCIPVDPWYFVEGFPNESGLLKTARQINDGQSKRIVDLLIGKGIRPGGKLAILGASYKQNIDDIRESPALLIAEYAKRAQLDVIAHDPHVTPGMHEGLLVSADLADVLNGADALILITHHDAYRSLSASEIKSRMKGKLVYDTRNWLNHKELTELGLTVLVLGKR